MSPAEIAISVVAGAMGAATVAMAVTEASDGRLVIGAAGANPAATDIDPYCQRTKFNSLGIATSACRGTTRTV